MNYSLQRPRFTVKPTLRNLSNVKSFSTKELDSTSDFHFVGFGRRVFITLINLSINALIIACSYYVLRYSIEYNTILPQFGYFFAWVALFTYMLVAFGISPGAFLARAKVVDKEGQYIDITAAFFRNLPYLISLGLHSMLMMNTIDNMPVSLVPHSLLEIYELYSTYSPFLLQILLSFQLFMLFDSLSTLFNPQRRALRDFLADSYVIDRRNYYNIFTNKQQLSTGLYQKSAEELTKEKERELDFKVLNSVMEIPEVMDEVQRVNEYKVGKMIAKIITRPTEETSLYEIILSESKVPLFHFRINPDNMRIMAKADEEFISLAQWRKKQYNVSWIKSYLSLG